MAGAAGAVSPERVSLPPLLLLTASSLGRAALAGLDDRRLAPRRQAWVGRPPITVNSGWRGRGIDLPKRAAVASALLVRRSYEVYPTVPPSLLYR